MKLDRARLRTVGLLTAALLLLTLPMVLLVEDFVRDAIVAPIAYFAWVAGVVASALPEGLAISIVVAIGFIVALRSLRPRRLSIWRAAHKPTPPKSGQVGLWRHRLWMLQNARYSSFRFRQHLGQLILSVLAHDERLSQRAILNRLNAGGFELPEPVQNAVRVVAQPELHLPRPSLATRLRSIFGRRQTTDLPAEIAASIAYLETHLALLPPEPAQSASKGEEP